MPINTTWQLKCEGLINGEHMENVYHYRQATGTGNAVDLMNAFADEVLPDILNWQANNVLWTTIRVINLGSLTDFGIATLLEAGTSTSNMLPAHDAINFTLRVNTRAVRPGKKRYSGIPVAAMTDGVIGDPTFIGLLNDLATQLAAEISRTTEPAASYRPIVIKRVPYVTSEGNDSYRLPETDAELVFGDVTGALWSTDISHQDTRGNGR